ncbi:hypothetical protein V8C86DRAFT_2600101 [Haematococcus lacustris]
MGGGGASGAGGIGFLAAAERMLREGLATGPRPKDMPRLVALMQVLVNLAAHSEGQHALLRSGAAPGLLELLLSLVLDKETVATPGTPHQDLTSSCLLLLRNLCFSPDAKTHLLAHPRLLPCLVAHAETPREASRPAALATAAIWTLIYQGEKVKAAVRRVPNALARLQAAQATADFVATKLAKSEGLPATRASMCDDGAAAGAEGVTRAASTGSTRCARGPGGGARLTAHKGIGIAAVEATSAVQQLHWLRLCSEHIGHILVAMAATQPGGPGQHVGQRGAGMQAGPGEMQVARSCQPDVWPGAGRDQGISM